MSKNDNGSGERKCVKCGKRYGLERHHVTYKPPIIKLLCAGCHRQITEINTVAAKMFGTDKRRKVKFTNVVRLSLWLAFLAPDRVGLSVDYMELPRSGVGH